ncbi:MAG: Dabb family protein [Bacteroidales bacterium]|nr:Dabb family protein [Bacteroidales bacterium]
MKKARRINTNKTLVFTALLMLFSVMAQAGSPEGAKVKVKGIQQILLIQFKKSTSDSTIQQIAMEAYNMKKRARTLKSVEWGKKTNLTDDTKDYDYCLTLSFSSETNFEIYNQNPVRLEFMGKLIPLSENILKFTYRVQKFDKPKEPKKEKKSKK